MTSPTSRGARVPPCVPPLSIFPELCRQVSLPQPLWTREGFPKPITWQKFSLKFSIHYPMSTPSSHFHLIAKNTDVSVVLGLNSAKCSVFSAPASPWMYFRSEDRKEMMCHGGGLGICS